jgi:hypothetical protein
VPDLPADIQRSIDELVEDIARFYGVTPDAVRAMIRRAADNIAREAIEGDPKPMPRDTGVQRR